MSKEFLLWLFYYDRENGKLYWKNHWNNQTRSKILNSEAGFVNNKGYQVVGIADEVYSIHRLIWLIETNELPLLIDHINGDKSDNRFENLRLSDNRHNSTNRKIHRDGKLVGASFRKDVEKWQARIRVNGVKKSLGYFDTEYEAHIRYMIEYNKITTNPYCQSQV